MRTPPTALEQHYTPAQIAKLWALSPDTIRSLFEAEPGVLRIDHPEEMHKRRYTTLRIPESVVVRVQDRLSDRRAA